MKTDVVYGLPYVELRAFHGSSAVKEEPLARLKRWKDMGELRLGRYGYNASQHTLNQLWEYTYLQTYGAKLGIPPHLAAVENLICEHLPEEEAAEFAVDFLEKTEVGAKLAYVFPRLGVWMLQNSQFGVEPTVLHEPSRRIIADLGSVCEELETFSGEELHARLETIKGNAVRCRDRHGSDAHDMPADYLAYRACDQTRSLCRLMQSNEHVHDASVFLHWMHEYAKPYPGWIPTVRDKLMELVAEAPIPE